MLLILMIACAAREVPLPSGAGAPFPEFATAFEAATSACRGVRTMTVAMGVSGRAGSVRLRGRVHAGLSAPASIRLEGLAPFGAPVFILVAQADASTLLLPRDDRVLRNAPPAAIVEAITGVSLTPDDLRAILAGCLVPDATATAGRAYGDTWRAIDLGRDAVAYLANTGGAWSLVAGTVGRLRVDYEERLTGSFPRRVRLRTTPATGAATDLRLSVTDLETNVPLDAKVFAVDVPASAMPITLDELRQNGPLRDSNPR